jgi:signal transduction histidine kinase
MNSPLLAGVFGAWAASEVALGLFFFQAYAARRREFEYFLFGLVCFALTVIDAGFAFSFSLHDLEFWPVATGVAHVGGFIASALNFHFVVLFVGPARLKKYVPYVYGVSLVASLVVVTGAFWQPHSVHAIVVRRFGLFVEQASASPTLIGLAAYSTSLLQDGWAVALLVRAYRNGRKEVTGGLFGLSVVIGCAASDVLTVMGIMNMPSLLPYGLLIYGFGVADTLLVRYRRAAEELEVTATELRSATEELTNSYLELSNVQEELFRKRQLASVGELAGAIAHEVRNPLAIIKNAGASLRRRNIGEDDKSTLFQIIEEEITRLNNLVSELLRYARPVNIRRGDIALPELVRGFSETLGESYPIALEIAAEPDVETVWADPSLLRLALSNVLDNARLAMPEGGTISVAAHRERLAGSSGVMIQITDTGGGMDSQTLRRAMDPFFSTRPSGTGLGLPIAGRIVEAHGGRVEVTSRHGEGTTVSLFIPAKRLDQRTSEPRMSPVPRP